MEQHEDHWIRRLLLIIIIPIVFYVTAITHRFGPYRGTVIDAETAEPLEGAVVLVAFYTELYTPGGTVSKYVGAVETMTDNNGQFSIDARRLWVLRFPQRWNPDCMVRIFKPGYAHYPAGFGVRLISYIPKYSIPANQFITISLPKLKTIEERKQNLDVLIFPKDVPGDKMSKLYEMTRIERRNVGLKP
jgi:hypothetical protein